MKSRLQRIWYSTLRWGLRFLFTLYSKVRFYNAKNVPSTGGCLLLSNHQSFFDPPLVGVGLERQLWYVARDSLFHNPVFGWLLHSVNAIPIKRGTADISAMKSIIEKLKQGGVVVLFPEATRTPDGRIADVKAGFGLLARRSKVPVIPVLVDGAYEAWPRNKKFPSPGQISVIYGDPIMPDTISRLSDEDFARELTCILRRMQAEYRTKHGKPLF